MKKYLKRKLRDLFCLHLNWRRSYWRDVNYELPKEDGLYFIHAPSADENSPFRYIAWYNPEFGWSMLPESWIKGITHWTPLPEPPLSDEI